MRDGCILLRKIKIHPIKLKIVQNQEEKMKKAILIAGVTLLIIGVAGVILVNAASERTNYAAETSPEIEAPGWLRLHFLTGRHFRRL